MLPNKFEAGPDYLLNRANKQLIDEVLVELSIKILSLSQEF